MLFLRRIRKKMINTKKLTSYVAYAIGEIILVVLGILIAIQINDWNRERELKQEELESYQLIIADLKRDSVQFNIYRHAYNRYMDTYFEMNKISQGAGSFQEVFPDFIVSNVEFSPATQNNHQATIEKLRNDSIRARINSYFQQLSRVHHAREEFNRLIEEESRPYFIKDQQILNNATVFDYEDRTFPPMKKASTVDTVQLRSTLSLPYSLAIISELRMSIGFYLLSLEASIKENHELIQELENSLEAY